ncbi:cytochrome P450 [Pullulanibacillus camelliae]|uniref:Cytochrome P450 n=1 Tax=Pullulanibacillus camelliae TaxID=1707096 RepID=A0A8J2YL87_9BACL|nr:cytochrome P450 [Pullulanibacillus camelliae]GGE51560.1 cytochrome P450 [Pullulanibacillus camelliae]
MVEQKESMPLDVWSDAFNQNPYPSFQHFREHSPVHHMTMPDGQTAWMIFRYEEAVAALKEERFVKDPTTFLNEKEPTEQQPHALQTQLFTHHMLNSDPPEHRRLRHLVQSAFTPRMIANLRPRIEAITNDLLDNIEGQKTLDLIDAFAFPLPITVICEMLGVPLEDRDKFREWSNALVEAANNPKQIQQIQPLMLSFAQYIDQWITHRQHNPQDDLISRLIRAEERGEQLTKQEIRSLIFLLIIAGHETTVNLIGNGLLALLEHPEQLDKLKKDQTLIHSAIEEMLRYDGPVEFSTARWASEDMIFYGQAISKGELILIALDSANHDPEPFQKPEAFDITRQYNRHLAFGKGIHFCLGAPLARLEGEVALLALLARYPHLQLAAEPSTFEWRPGILIRGLKHLPIRLNE